MFGSSTQFIHRLRNGIKTLRNTVFYTAIFTLLGFGSTVFDQDQVIAAEKSAYRLGVFPYLPPREIEKIYAAIAADFSKALNRDILFQTSSSYHRFIERTEEEQFEILFVQPFAYLDLAEDYGYQAIAARKKPLRGIVVTLSDNSLKDLDSLRGKTLALTPRTSAVSYLLKSTLKEQGIIPGRDVKISHSSSHFSCMQKVMTGVADACGTAGPAVLFFEHKMNVKMKTIAKSKAIPSSPFAVHPSVTKEERALLKKRILSWSETEEGKNFLKKFQLAPFRDIGDSDYDIVRTMR